MIKEPTFPDVGKVADEDARNLVFFSLLAIGESVREAAKFAGGMPEKFVLASSKKGPAFCFHERIHTRDFRKAKCQDCGGYIILYLEDEDA